MPWPLVIAVLLLIANGFFVGAEFALIAARRSKIEQLAQEGDRKAKIALRSVRELSFMLAGAQLGEAVIWHQPGANRFSGDHVGLEGVGAAVWVVAHSEREAGQFGVSPWPE